MLKRITLPNWFVVTALLSTCGLLFFLFYIDEGYCDFRWMKSIGNWIVFFIYWMVLFWVIIGVGFLMRWVIQN